MRAIDRITFAFTLASVALGTDAAAFPHVVRQGDTPAGLAEQFYGRIDRERILVAANHLDGGANALTAGMRIEIPSVSYHVVGRGESWASIAAAELGGVSRGDVLARLNKSEPWEPPAVGREIVLPYPLHYVATQGDTLETVAYRFLGRRDDAWMLLSYNGVSRPRFSQGQVLLVPILDLALTEAGKRAARLGATSTERESGGRATAMQAAAERTLATLGAELRAGNFISAISLGASLAGQGELSEPQLARVHGHLTEAFVAVGANELAIESCATWRKLDPSVDLDPVHYSPKILSVCAAPLDGGASSTRP